MKVLLLSLCLLALMLSSCASHRHAGDTERTRENAERSMERLHQEEERQRH